MTLDDMVKRHGSWLEAGVDEGPVISSRVRLARNVDGYSFPGWASEEENYAVWKQAADIFHMVSDDCLSWSMRDTSELDKEILFERHLISQELSQQDDGCGVFVTPDECHGGYGQ